MLASEVHSSILTRTHESDSVLQGDPDRVADLPALHNPVPGGPHLLPHSLGQSVILLPVWTLLKESNVDELAMELLLLLVILPAVQVLEEGSL